MRGGREESAVKEEGDERKGEGMEGGGEAISSGSFQLLLYNNFLKEKE